MTTYELRDNPGCVIQDFTAVQFTGDPEVIRETFPDLDVNQPAENSAVVVSDRVGDRLVFLNDWVIQVEDQRVLVLSDNNFRDTYVASRAHQEPWR